MFKHVPVQVLEAWKVVYDHVVEEVLGQQD